MNALSQFKTLYAVIMAAVIASLAASAQQADFIVDGIYYKMSDDRETVSVVNPDPGKYQFPLVDGVLTIPSHITYEDIDYEVTGITNVTGQKDMAKLICPATCSFVSTISDCPQLQSIDLGGTTSAKDIGYLVSLKELNAQMDEPLFIERFSGLAIEEFVTPRLVFERLSFRDWDELRYLDLSLTEHFGPQVLYNFPKLETLILPRHVTYHIAYCLYNLPSLQSLTMPQVIDEGVAIIDALNDCSNLTTIYCPSAIPPEVKTLTNPEDFEWPAAYGNTPTATPLADNPGEGNDRPEEKYAYVNVGGENLDTDGCTVYVPQGCVEVYKAHHSWSMFKNIREYDFSSREVITADGSDVKPTVRVVDGSIVVDGNDGFAVYDNMGRIARHDNLTAGVYVVKPDGGDAVKVVIR